MDCSDWCAVEDAPGRIWQLEQRLQTVRPMVRSWGMGTYDQYFVDDPDMENLIIDSTVVRAHHSAAGAPKKTVGKRPKPLVEVVAGSLQRFT